MKLDSVFRKTKTGITVELRSAAEADAETEIRYLKDTCAETPFLLSEPEDVDFTPEGEREFLKAYEEAPDRLMLNAYVDGVFAGNASFAPIKPVPRMKHRMELGIAIYLKYTGQGIGEVMLGTLLEIAPKCGYESAELDVYAKNARGIALYKKLGFEETGRIKKAIKYKDGSYDDLVLMQKLL